MMPVAGWRAWYADGAVYHSGVTPAGALPADGCVGFVVYYERRTPAGDSYRDQVKARDWYVVLPCGRVVGHGTRDNGTWPDPPATAPDEPLIRSAPTLPDDQWARIYADMLEARTWP